MLYFTAAASKGSPSWNLTPRRSLTTSPIRSSVHFHSVASCGTISSSRPISNNRSQSAVRTTPLTKVRLSVGSRVSGSSASPIRKLCASDGSASSVNPATQTANTIRRLTIASSLFVSATDSSFQAHTLRPDQPVRQRGKATQLGAERPQPFLMIEIDDGAVCERLLGNFVIVGKPVGSSLDDARGVELGVDILVAIAADVERRRRLAGNKIVDIAVGVEPSAPADQIGLEIALCGEFE